jgi:hypothetical protein
MERKYLPWKVLMPLMLLYAIVSTIGILHHEIWLDEAQHFVIARDSASITDLYKNMQYDGHVQLWNYLLYFITHYISAEVIAMQLFHLLIINAAVFLFLRFGPFPLWIKVPVIFSYYFLFEYSLISRNYAPGILLLLIMCILIQLARQNRWAIGSLLLLLCVTHLFFVFAAIGFMIFLLINRGWREMKIPLSFLAVGLLLAAIPLLNIPADNTYFHPGATTQELLSKKSISYVLYSPGRAFLPLQSPEGDYFWNTYWFDDLSAGLKTSIALLLLIAPVLLLRKSKAALAFYSCAAGLLLLFLFVTQMKGNRYFGMMPMFLICACWLATYEQRSWITENLTIRRSAGIAFGVMITFQLIAGIYAWSQDVSRPFAQAKSVISFLQENNQRLPVLVDGYGSGPALSAYYHEPLFYLDIDQYGSYCKWKRSYFHVPAIPLMQEISTSSYAAGLDSFTLISVRPAPFKDEVYTFKELAVFQDGLMKPTQYVYKVTKTNEHSMLTKR